MFHKVRKKLIERHCLSFHFDLHAAGLIPHKSAQPQLQRQTIDKRPKTHPLNRPLNRYRSAFGHR